MPPARRLLSRSSTLYLDRKCVAEVELGLVVELGRSIIASGINWTISRHRSHLWKFARLSAPITQTKLAAGRRRLSKLMVSAEYLKLYEASNAVTLISGWVAMRWHFKILSVSPARLFCCFNGLPGVTSHHIWSSCNFLIAVRLACKWPWWGGLNDPPNKPIRMPREAGGILKYFLFKIVCRMSIKAVSGHCHQQDT